MQMLTRATARVRADKLAVTFVRRQDIFADTHGKERKERKTWTRERINPE
jgi:hypothetical protein